MMRLIRNKNITASDINPPEATEGISSVSIEKLKEILPAIQQLRHHDVHIGVKEDGNILLTIDNITYEWNCQEMCSRRIPKI